MRVLALDTTTAVGSVAIVDDDRVLTTKIGSPGRAHAERLPEDVFDVLGAADLTVMDVDLFAVASGPGSFTGLRIGIAAIQGLAFVTGRRVVPVSALEALAAAAAEGLPAGALVGAWMNAHRHEVFGALFRTTAGAPYGLDHLQEVDPASVGSPREVLARWAAAGSVPSRVAGDGAVMYAAVLGRSTDIVPPQALAPIIGRLAVGRGAAGAVTPAGILPVYVRRPDAEIARDRAR